MVVLSGTSNPDLAGGVARQLGVTLGDLEITRFIDNECRVYVRESIGKKRVFVIQSLSQIADQHLVELLLIGHALKQLKAVNVTAVIPWMGYSKQDKQFRPGEAVSAQLVAKLLEVAGFDGVITLELHSENITPYFRIPVTELSTHRVLAAALGSDRENMTVVSPDKGGQSRSDRFATETGLPIVHLTKSRDLVSGVVSVTGIDGTVIGRDIVIFDDIINTGSTAIETSRFLKTQGAGKIYFLATHAVLAGTAPEKLESSPIDEVVVTDTIAVPESKRFPKLRTVSVAPLIAGAIREEMG